MQNEAETKKATRRAELYKNAAQSNRAELSQSRRGETEKWLRCLCPIVDGHVEKQAKASSANWKEQHSKSRSRDAASDRDREPKKRRKRDEAWRAEWVKTAWKETWNGLSADKWMPRLTAHVYADKNKKKKAKKVLQTTREANDINKNLAWMCENKIKHARALLWINQSKVLGNMLRTWYHSIS